MSLGLGQHRVRGMARHQYTAAVMVCGTKQMAPPKRRGLNADGLPNRTAEEY